MGVNNLPKTVTRLRFEPGPFQHANHWATEPPSVPYPNHNPNPKSYPSPNLDKLNRKLYPNRNPNPKNNTSLTVILNPSSNTH